MPVCNTQFGQYLFHPTVSPASLTVGIGLHRRSVTIGAIEMLVYMLMMMMMMIYIRGTGLCPRVILAPKWKLNRSCNITLPSAAIRVCC